ncbi:hypothetical protein SAMN05421548_101102 [Paraburkholderia lycopersici]|uniref:Uncharacterized protein n=2 Tax=Paraburkholderia lycopersici TaxID=416944 RepID=A0A1G6GM98_9BURK|nr:hypothetical protein SAMN05421548_101102 [Paraburkholderia lycopersici]
MNSASIVACTPPYSVVFSFTAPDMQMVVVPAMSTSATTDMAKVSFTVLPLGSLQNGQFRGPVSVFVCGDLLAAGLFGAVPNSG